MSAGLWASVLVLCVVSLIYILQSPLPATPEPLRPSPTKPKVQVDARKEFFDEAVQPAIAQADRANREAAARCVKRLEENFNDYRKGIPKFTEDLTSWGTRWGVVTRMPSDWWYEKTDVESFVTKKFETRLFSNQSLQRSIEDALAKFREDIEDNNNKLLTDVQAAVAKSTLPRLPTFDSHSYSADITKSLQRYSAEAATRSVQNLVLTEVASGVGGAAATQIVVAVGTRLAAMVATTAATAGGATAVGGAAGGTGGTLAGPVGTAVGAGVGIAAGVVVDWWMSSNFRTKLAGELNDMIDNLSATVLDGDGTQLGVKQSLAETCDALRDAYRQSLYNRIVQESSR
jgi:hypothetical protein